MGDHEESVDSSVSLPMWTYAITDDNGFLKIGKSVRPSKRLTEVQIGNPRPLRILGLLEGDQEDLLHRRFHGHRVSGEWFVAHPNILSVFDKGKQPEEVVVRGWNKPPFVHDDDCEEGELSLVCPECANPDAPAWVIETYTSFDSNKYARPGDARQHTFVVLVCECYNMQHQFEVAINYGGTVSTRIIKKPVSRELA